MSIAQSYAGTDGLIEDPAQRQVVARLERLQQALLRRHARAGWRRWLPLGRPAAPVRGLYLWGGVGRGKTFLMDLFYSTLPLPAKRRMHFHRMMGDVHRQLTALGDVEDPLARVAATIADQAKVLCFDEFFVSDIGDAMILGRLLDGLFRRGVTLVATSNSPPSELYRDGLQRARFEPAIALLEMHTRVVQLDGGADYRLRVLRRAGTFVPSSRPDATSVLEECFRRIASGDSEPGRVLEILGRPLQTLRAARGVAWFEFDALCAGPRSAQDYVELAQLYHTVIVSEVPVMDRSRDDEARRFIALVDELYDRRVKLILSAAAPPDSLYQGEKLKFEFERTISRLHEMQAEEYLALPHRP